MYETNSRGGERVIEPTRFAGLLAQARAEAMSGSAAHIPATRQPMLNGVPYQAFRQSVSLDDRRSAGTFFSGVELASELADLLHTVLPEGSYVFDPTCGIGDLLLAYAAHLPLGSSLAETLAGWGEQLGGIDRRAELVAMAKARLVALARTRGAFSEPIESIDSLFPNIVVGDMFEETARIAAADGFLFNPPFGGTSDHSVSDWGTGKLNAAALFLDALVLARKADTPIAALLPEVLRCGSRYARFRARLAEFGIGGEFTSRGRFDAWTDVDVLTTLLGNGPAPLWPPRRAHENTLGDHFSVKVGPVVPHRHKREGHWQRFICAKSVPAWSKGFTPVLNRRFKGTVFMPPFVVVRRTSSPSDRKRAVGAIILGDRPVAVENHLIVLLPKQGGRPRCEELLEVLASDATSDHLNHIIRCRHLTTSSLMATPWRHDS